VVFTTGFPFLKEGLAWFVDEVGGGMWWMGIEDAGVPLAPASLSVYEGGRPEISGASS